MDQKNIIEVWADLNVWPEFHRPSYLVLVNEKNIIYWVPENSKKLYLSTVNSLFKEICLSKTKNDISCDESFYKIVQNFQLDDLAELCDGLTIKLNTISKCFTISNKIRLYRVIFVKSHLRSTQALTYQLSSIATNLELSLFFPLLSFLLINFFKDIRSILCLFVSFSLYYTLARD